MGVAVDPQGSVYVADWENARIQKFDGQGRFLAKWDSKGKADGQFLSPLSVTVDRLSNVYIMDIDPGTDRVQKFDSNGKFLAKWGSFGSGDGQFGSFGALVADGQGNIYVADAGFNRVQKVRCEWKVPGEVECV